MENNENKLNTNDFVKGIIIGIFTTIVWYFSIPIMIFYSVKKKRSYLFLGFVIGIIIGFILAIGLFIFIYSNSSP